MLDLGCGEGDLLAYLKRTKGVVGTGIECSEDRVEKCITKGQSVLQGDFNEEVLDYPNGAFDYVILSLTLQQVNDPERLINEMLRIGNKGIVSFPNFSHWGMRSQFMFTGCAPKSAQFPFDWYNTPNIRTITLKDFARFARGAGFKILRAAAINTRHDDRHGNIVHFMSNLRATYGIFLIGR